MEAGNVEREEQRMKEKDDGLAAKHITECSRGINWEEVKIVGRESGQIQRKMIEGVETMKQKAIEEETTEHQQPDGSVANDGVFFLDES